jgi:hypothetical protein
MSSVYDAEAHVVLTSHDLEARVLVSCLSKRKLSSTKASGTRLTRYRYSQMWATVATTSGVQLRRNGAGRYLVS